MTGKGAYERVTSLKYVGEGHGSINKDGRGAFRVLVRRDGAQLAGEASPQCPPSSCARHPEGLFTHVTYGETTTRLKQICSCEDILHYILLLNVAHIFVSGRCMHSSHPGGSCVGQWPLTSGWCDSLYAGPPCADRQDQG